MLPESANNALDAFSSKIIAFVVVMILCSIVGMLAGWALSGNSKETRKNIYTVVTVGLMIIAGYFFL